MILVLVSIILILVLLESITRKQKNSLNEKNDSISRRCLEERLDQIEDIKYTYGKIFAFNLNDLSLILVHQNTYSKSDQLIIMHELGHYFSLYKTNESLRFKALIYSKVFFYFGGVLSMFIFFMSLIWKPAFVFFRILLFGLIVIQIIHLISLIHSEILANKCMDTYFDEENKSLFYVYTSMVSQVFYWLLFLVLTIAMYGLIFN